MGRAAALLLLLCAACPRPVPPPQGPGALPTPTCRDAWARLPGGGDYDFAHDSQVTPKGNLGYAGYAARANRRGCHKKWTVLIYMEADNDLWPYAYLDLYEMEAAFPGHPNDHTAASTADTDVLVRLDTPGGGGLRRLHMFQTDTPYDETLTRASFAARSEAQIRSPVVELQEEREGWDAAGDLRSFLTWGATEYPSEHYLVVVWGHGAGWGLQQTVVPPPPPPPEGPPAPGQTTVPGEPQDPFPLLTGGIAFDWSQRTYLGIPTLRQVLGDVVRGPLGGQPIDVYLSDACLMQSLEVTTELGGVARFLAGSDQVEDYLGTSYRDLVHRLNTGAPTAPACALYRDREACTVAALIPQVYQGSLHDGLRARISPDAASKFTLSAVRAAALREQVLPAFARLGAALSGYLAEAPTHPGAVRNVLSDSDSPSFLGNYRDAGVFLGLLSDMLRRQAHATGHDGQLTPAGAQLEQAIAVARAALLSAEVGRAFGGNYANAAGFLAYSVWLPPDPDDYRRRGPGFAPSALFQYGRDPQGGPGPWRAWLDQLYPPAPAVESVR